MSGKPYSLLVRLTEANRDRLNELAADLGVSKNDAVKNDAVNALLSIAADTGALTASGLPGARAARTRGGRLMAKTHAASDGRAVEDTHADYTSPQALAAAIANAKKVVTGGSP